MTNTEVQARPGPETGSFDANGRTVASGRGWDWIVDAFALFRRQPGMWILIVLLAGILFIAIGMIPVLGYLASTLMLPVFGDGLMLGCRAVDQGDTLELAHLFAGFKHKTGDLVLVGAFNLVVWLVVGFAVYAVIGGGVIAGIMRGGMPGAGISLASMLIAMLLAAGVSVPLYMATWFAPALIALDNVAPGAALKASYNACLRNWLPFLIYSMALLVLCLLAAIPAGLGYLVLIPVLVASVYTAYRDIFRTGQ